MKSGYILLCAQGNELQFLYVHARAGEIPKLHPLIIAYPVIVFEGKLLECSLEEGDFKISETRYVRYLIQEGVVNHVIEIVTKDFLKEYLWMVNHEIDVIGNRF